MTPVRTLAGRILPWARPAFLFHCVTYKGGLHALKPEVDGIDRIDAPTTGAGNSPSKHRLLKEDQLAAARTLNPRAPAAFVCAVAFIMWSSVMSQSANAYRFTPTEWEFQHLSPEKVRQIETSGRPPKHIPRTIDIRTIPPAAQAAFISLSPHPLCQTMTQVLRSSSVRFNVHDFAVLRQLGLVERGEGNRWHRLTEDGKAYAHQVAQQIATEMGLHKIWTASGGSKFYRTVHCTCGWTTRLYSERFDAGKDHQHRIARHLAEAAGATRPVGET